jgi:hypothetical protein
LTNDTSQESQPTLQAHFYFAQAAVQNLSSRRSKNKKELAISLATRHARTVVNIKRGELATYNSTYPKGGVSCFADSFVVAESSVLRMKFSGKNPALRVAAKR